MIAVIIPTRNRLGMLREAVASVTSQSFTGWELIVVDDASDDGTWEWLQSLDDKRIRSIRMRQRQWQSEARNAGLREAQSEFILFLDHDDFLLEGALARLLKALQSHQSAIAAVGARIDVGPEGRRRVPHPRHGCLRDTWLDAMFGWVPQCGQVLLRRSAVMQTGGWRSEFIPAEDHDLWVRFSQLGPVALIPQAVLGYRIHSGQTLKIFEASHSARTTRTIALRRTRVAKLSGSRRTQGERTLQAWRHHWIASRAFRHGNYFQACRHCWLTLRQAPWLLASPLGRPEIQHVGLRSLVGLVLGEQAMGWLRRVKRVGAAALRRHRREPSSSQAGLGIQRPEAP